jgi:hypothetical protein
MFVHVCLFLYVYYQCYIHVQTNRKPTHTHAHSAHTCTQTQTEEEEERTQQWPALCKVPSPAPVARAQGSILGLRHHRRYVTTVDTSPPLRRRHR